MTSLWENEKSLNLFVPSLIWTDGVARDGWNNSCEWNHRTLVYLVLIWSWALWSEVSVHAGAFQAQACVSGSSLLSSDGAAVYYAAFPVLNT